MQNPSRPRVDYFLVLLAIAFLAALLSFAYLGHFTRYMADEYCTAVALRQAGFLKTQINSYQGWTGRFSFNFALGLAESFGLIIVPVLPSMAILSWFAASLWSTYQSALLLARPRPLLISTVVAGLVVFATANGSPNIVQSCYWQTGLLTYTLPLIFGTIFMGLTAYGLRQQLEKKRVLWLVILSVMVTFVAGGFSEVYVFLQTGALSLALGASFLPGSGPLRRAARPFMIAGMIGSAIALTVVILAPGNKTRQSFFPPPPGLLTTIRLTLYYTVHAIAATPYHFPLTTLLVVLLPWRLGAQTNASASFNLKSVKWFLLLSPLIAFGLVFICLLPGIYATSGELPGRARIIPQFVFVCSATVWWCVAGALSKRLHIFRPKSSWLRTFASVGAAVLIVLSPFLATWRTLKLIPGARASAVTWDQTDRDIRAAKSAGITDVTIPGIDDLESRLGASANELQIEHDSENWKNKCVAEYYGVQSITAR